MCLESGRDQGGLQVFRLPDGTIIRPVIVIDQNGKFVDIETGIVLATGNNTIGKVKITDSNNREVLITVPFGGQPNQGTLDVHIADVHERLVNLFVSRQTGVNTVLSAPASSGDTSIDIVPATYANYNVGDQLQIIDGASTEVLFFTITAKPGSPTLTLDMPLAFDHVSGTLILGVDKEISNANGSLSSPISFRLAPPPGQVWHIQAATLFMQTATAMDTSKFGDIAGGLTNGVVIRALRFGQIRNLLNIKTNGDLLKDIHRVEFHNRAPAGSFGLNARWLFQDLKTYIKVDGDRGEYLELLIQDDLTDLEIAQVKFQGHVEEP